jgi:DNA-binding SARP family transcriptional activator
MGSLRQAVWKLRGCGHQPLLTSLGLIGLAPEVVVDVRELIALAHELEAQQPGPAVSAWGPFEDELLPDWYEDWVMVWRERWRQVRLHALESLSEALTREGSYARAIEAALAAVRAEPLRESAHRALIAVHLAEGNRTEAIRQYDAYSQQLQQSLSLTPSPTMSALLARD